MKEGHRQTDANSDSEPPRPRRRERFHGRVEREGLCQRPGCDEPGEFRAPVTGAPHGTWQYFCLQHVREFNEGYSWRGEALRANGRWDRATQAFAANAYANAFADEMGIFRERFGADAFPETAEASRVRLSPEDHAALGAFDLDRTATRADIRARYKELVRRYHPDMNGGDRSHERELQAVIDAYTQLRRSTAFAE
ncbi:J domain-containing protein [Pacificimonas flava]|uniref:J domain-containing protein n=1 Tax=Pacificimonas flava TaxID=1234595 RepID=M2TBH1_9SPHN|nr:J domain-containing protein [Pacificimonas flava]EMD83964.1 hypothetical protein C725_0936 [Pacificimonas flava]MBB5281063.1 hypothetical protein [Pacificimonas flava]